MTFWWLHTMPSPLPWSTFRLWWNIWNIWWNLSPWMKLEKKVKHLDYALQVSAVHRICICSLISQSRCLYCRISWNDSRAVCNSSTQDPKQGYHLKHSVHPIHGWCHKLILNSWSLAKLVPLDTHTIPYHTIQYITLQYITSHYTTQY